MRVATGLGAESEPTAEGGGVPGLGSDALARLLDALPIGVGLQDPEGRFFWVNPVLVRQLGMPARRHLEARMHGAVHVDGDRTGLGGGFEGEQFHPVPVSAKAGSAKKARTSWRSRVRGSGGSESRNNRP